MAGKAKSPDEPITIKKYANRRLYNTATSSYVTLDHLAEMVKNGQEFNVYDARTNEDITRSILTQIIFEEENKGQNLLPIQFLRQLIGLYGDQMQSVVPGYLQASMEAFARNQEKLRESMKDAFSTGQPFKVFEEIARQNTAMFQETWLEAYKRMMNFSAGSAPCASGAATPRANGAHPAETGEPAEEAAQIRELRDQLEAMKRRLDQLTSAQKSD